MIDMHTLLNLELTLYAMMAVGLILKKIGFLNPDGEKFLSNLVMYIILPCSIMKSFLIELTPDLVRQFFTTIAAGVCIIALEVLITQTAFRRFPADKRKAMQYGMVNPNSTFLGFPIVEGIFGAGGLTHAAMYQMPPRVVIWTYGLSLFTSAGLKGRELVKKCLLHPCMVGAYLGIFFMVTQVRLPAFVTGGLSHMASCLTALSMLLIGSILAEVKPKKLLSPPALWFCLFRLVLMPGAVLLGCKLLGIDPAVAGVCTLMAGMPAASITVILAVQYGTDTEFAGVLVTVSTLLSTLTLPLWALALSWL